MNRLIPFALMLTLTLQGWAGIATNAPIALTGQQIENLGIETGRAQPSGGIPVLLVPARVTIPPSQEYVVSAPYAGLVETVDAAIGEPVRKKQRLARINSPELLTVQRDLLNDTTALNLAAATLRRDRILFNEGIVSKRRWQESRGEYDKYAALVNEAKQRLGIAGLGPGEIRTLLRTRRLSGTTTVRAPADGVILEQQIMAGARVDPLTPLFRLANLKRLWLDISLPQERAADVALNDEVGIEQTDIRARIILIGQAVNPDNQSVLVRALVDNASGQLRPGQKVTVRLLQPASDTTVTIPARALLWKGRESYVFVPVDGGFEARPVTVAGREQESVTIGRGLAPGEAVVIRGAAALKAIWLGLGGDE